jgi:hypothetical protein
VPGVPGLDFETCDLRVYTRKLLMDTIDLLDSELVNLPKNRDIADFETFLKSWFFEFLSEIREIEGNDWVAAELRRQEPALRNLCAAILCAVDAYLLGFPHHAYNYLRDALISIQSSIDEVASPNRTMSLEFLYRIRIGSLAEYKRPDLFHVPFEKRHLVKPQRYSILGLPSLYLGGSSWVCWEELSRPAFERIQISRFTIAPSSTVRVLDFGYRPAVIAGYMKFNIKEMADESIHSKFVLAHAICWPLLAACSIRVMNQNSAFTPEYIVPQLLLQWVRDDSEIDGIQYFSTRISQYSYPADPACNYVFPVRTKNSTGFCNTLAEKFHLSRPTAWSLIDQLPLGENAPVRRNPEWELNINPDVKIEYWKTHFYKCETKINSLPCGSVLMD